LINKTEIFFKNLNKKRKKMKRKFFLAIFLLCLVFTNSYSQQDVNGWYWLNGKPTGVQLNWIQIVDAANMYAVGDRGMFMKSVDGGDTWSLNSQVGSPDNSSTGNLATRSLNTGYFFNANTGYVAGQSLTTTPGYIKKTTDGGNTFSALTYNDTGGTVNKFHFINSNTGYLCGGTRARFFKTTDGGATWTDQSYGGQYFATGTPSFTYLAVWAIDTSHIFLAPSTTSRKLYKHFPGQDSAWKIVILPGTVTNASITDIVFKDANTGYVCGNANYFAYTTDGGVTWTQSLSSSNVGLRDLTYDATNGTLYMGGNYNYIYKSTNDGATWDSLYFHDGSNANQPNPFIIYGIGAVGNDMAAIGANGIMNLSNDGGATWRNKNYTANPTYTFYSSLLVSSATGTIWTGCASGGLMTSSNGGTNWSARTTSHVYSIYGMQFVNSNTGYICGGSASFGLGEFSKTVDGGNTWNSIALPSPMNAYQLNNLNFVDANTGYCSGFSSPFATAYIFKTTDGGTSWVSQTIGSPAANGSVINVQMVNANTGYAVASAGFYSTTDGGTTWVKNTNAYLTGLSFSNMYIYSKDIIYLNGQGTSTSPGSVKKVIRSLDGGNTWSDLTGNLLYTFTAFRTKWINNKHGVVSGTNGYMAKTTNGGLNWSESNPGFSTTVDLALPEKNTWFTISDRNSSYQIGRKYDNITSISVNVNSLMEGFWNGKPLITDSVTVELHNSTAPYAVVDVAKEVVNINGFATYEFYTAPAGTYYIVVKHRNSLQTWSAAPVVMAAGGNYNYDFTTASTQAYGSNMILKAGAYCLYSGDINQDETIDGADLSLCDNGSLIGLSGYVKEDVNGDNFVDSGDLAIVDNNATSGISVIKP
jgi:photosystem II stability/assembly factor-like uncharacterized protein